MEIRTAILVDGGFYRKRADTLYGYLSPKKRANELSAYCHDHLLDTKDSHHLYRIFYYDCPPVEKKVYNPLTKEQIDLSKSDACKWMNDFLSILKAKRKFALRLGELSDTFASYTITPKATKKLLAKTKTVDELTYRDVQLYVGEQKGVDMKIGIDIASLAYKKLVDQIILISGDSDFVPAAKLARREGIDFVLDPMGIKIKDNLFEHIDGLRTPNGWKIKP